MGFRPLTNREVLDGWTFFSMASVQPIYVVLTPPGKGQSAIPLPLAGLPIEHREALRELRRGDRVPPSIVGNLLVLAPQSALRTLSPFAERRTQMAAAPLAGFTRRAR